MSDDRMQTKCIICDAGGAGRDNVVYNCHECKTKHSMLPLPTYRLLKSLRTGSDRKAFEKIFPVPDGVVWSEHHQEYVGEIQKINQPRVGPATRLQNARWQGFQVAKPATEVPQGWTIKPANKDVIIVTPCGSGIVVHDGDNDDPLSERILAKLAKVLLENE